MKRTAPLIVLPLPLALLLAFAASGPEDAVDPLTLTPVAITYMTFNQATEAHGHGTEVVLEAGVVAASRGILVDNNLWSAHFQPDIRFPGID